MSIAIYRSRTRDLLLIEEGSGLLIPKGIVEVKTELMTGAEAGGVVSLSS